MRTKRSLEILIPPSWDGRTLLKYLKNELAFSSAKVSSVKFDPDGLLLNGQRVTVRALLHEGDRLSVLLADSERKENHLIPNEMPLTILYEDEDLIAVDKPAGLVCHPSKGHLVDSLSSGLRAYFDRQDPAARIHLIGRLDKETSGIVLSAKNAVAAAVLEKSDSVQKTYTAFASGVFEEKEGRITIPMVFSRDREGILCVRAGNSIEDSREGKFGRNETEEAFGEKSGEESREKAAETVYTVLSGREDFSVLRVRIGTGRMHQIRFHMAETGHPLLGDRRYGGPEEKIGRAALHAGEMTLVHPFTQERICLTAPLPEDMKRLLS